MTTTLRCGDTVREHGGREIRGIDGDLRINRALWALGSKMAELKRAA